MARCWRSPDSRPGRLGLPRAGKAAGALPSASRCRLPPQGVESLRADLASLDAEVGEQLKRTGEVAMCVCVCVCWEGGYMLRCVAAAV